MKIFWFKVSHNKQIFSFSLRKLDRYDFQVIKKQTELPLHEHKYETGLYILEESLQEINEKPKDHWLLLGLEHLALWKINAIRSAVNKVQKDSIFGYIPMGLNGWIHDPETDYLIPRGYN